MRDNSLTVIATSFNDEVNVGKFIENLERQTVLPQKLIIADGGSRDKTVEAVVKKADLSPFPIEVIHDKGRLNIAQGYNVAIRQVKTELILILGIGNAYEDVFIEKLLSYKNSNDTEVVYTPVVGVEVNSFSRAYNAAFVGGDLGKDFGMPSNRGMLIEAAVFDRIGVFWEHFIYAGEDMEFFYRLQQNDVKMGCQKDTRLFWETPKSFSEYLKKTKVNAIADLQCEKRSRIVRNIAIRLAVILTACYCMITGHTLILGVLLALFLILTAVKIKSIYVLALCLRLHFFFLPAYYYVVQCKYWKDEYRCK